MKVELSIKDDKELRDHIKDCIRGQVVSIARDEIKSIISDTTEKRIGKDAVVDCIRSVVKNEVEKALGGYHGKTQFIRNMAKELVHENVRFSLKE